MITDAPAPTASERTADHLIDHVIDHPEDLDEFIWDVKLLPEVDLQRLLAGLDASVARDLKARLDHMSRVRLCSSKTGYCVTGEGKVVDRVKTDEGGLVNKPIADGYALIREELQRPNGTMMYLVEGRGADGHTFSFHIDASDFGDERLLRRALAARFGSKNVVSGLAGDIIKRITLDAEKYRLADVPSWIDGKAAVPGMKIPGVRYVLSPKCPAHVGGGNLADGIKCYQKLIEAFDSKQATIALMPVFGSPVIAQYLPDDRFAVMIYGVTGTFKTSFVMLSTGIYGLGYLDESNLQKWGMGGTTNAHMKAAAVSGMLPVLYDNYKPLTYKDAPSLVGLIHAIVEGSDKNRLNKDSEFQESLAFHCIPIVTGEDFVDEASTLARCVSFEWRGCDPKILTEAQALQNNLPAVGKEWLTWLQDNPDKIKAAVAGFEGIRQEYIEKIKSSNNNINVGRIASNLAVIKVVWNIALLCPVTEAIFKGHEKDFEDGIAELLSVTPSSLSETSEAEIFVTALRELISSGRARVVNVDRGAWREEIGRSSAPEIGWIKEGELCVYPDIARKLVREIAPTTQHISNKTLYKQLDERGYIQADVEGGQRKRTLKRTHPIRTGHVPRVLVFDVGVLKGEEISIPLK